MVLTVLSEAGTEQMRTVPVGMDLQVAVEMVVMVHDPVGNHYEESEILEGAVVEIILTVYMGWVGPPSAAMVVFHFVYLEVTEQHTLVVAVEEAVAVMAAIKLSQFDQHLEVVDRPALC
eukprot:gene61553-biopygen8611